MPARFPTPAPPDLTLPTEPLDSASVAMAGVQAALAGRAFRISQRYPALYRLAAPLLARLPARGRVGALRLGIRLLAGTSPGALRGITPEALDAHWLSGWPRGRFGEVHLGSPSGAGAAAAAAAAAPWLPASALFALRHRKHPDNLGAVVAKAGLLGPPLAARLEDWQLVWHHDPVHDRFLVGSVQHLRLRLKRLPAAWGKWLESRLEPGGKVVVTDLPAYQWPRHSLGAAGALQVGGLGGMEPGEFPAPAGAGAPQPAQESEWGCEEGFVPSVEEWANRRGLRFEARRFATMGDLSAASFAEQCETLAKVGFLRRGVAAVDCFTFADPGSWHRLGIPVLWVAFNTVDGLELVRATLAEHKIRQTFWTAVPAYPATPDTATYEEWEEAFAPHGGVAVGINRGRFPSDPMAPVAYDNRGKLVKAALGNPLA